MESEASKQAPLTVSLNVGMTVGLLGTEGLSEPLAEQAAKLCVRILRQSGNYRPRYLAYLAGRSVISAILRKKGLLLHVESDPDYGYLKLVPTHSGPPTELDTGSPKQSFINVSHTDGLAAAAFNDFAVGIDVELLTRDASRALSRVSHPEELRRLPDTLTILGQSIPGALVLWCAKEAVSKAFGLGIVFGMKAFQIDFSQPSPFPVHFSGASPLHLDSPAVWIESRGRYLFAICSEAHCFSRPIDWVLEEEVRSLCLKP